MYCNVDFRFPLGRKSLADRFRQFLNGNSLEYPLIIYSVTYKGLVPKCFGLVLGALLGKRMDHIISASVSAIISFFAYVSRQ